LTDEAVVLGIGLSVYEASLCSCGVPVGEAWDDDQAAGFDVHAVICKVCAMLESKRDSENKPPAGRKMTVGRRPPTDITASSRRRRKR
jgi:hypothetical protein